MDPALGKAADLGAEGGCAETKFLRVSNLPTYPYHLASDTPAAGMALEEAGGVDPALCKAADLGGEGRQMAAEEWRPRKLCPRKQNDGR